MSEALLVALLSFGGTIAGSLLGILAANKLVMYRLEQLERKVEAHNHLIERMAVVKRDLKTAFRLLDAQEEERKGCT